jgi:hypothetical protein
LGYGEDITEVVVTVESGYELGGWGSLEAIRGRVVVGGKSKFNDL